MSCTTRYAVTTLGVLVCFAVLDGIFYGEAQDSSVISALIVGLGLSWAMHNDSKNKE